MTTKVVNKKYEKFDVYIGRPSIWGNPFLIGRDGDRDEVVDKYKDYLISNPKLMSKILELDGKTLGCFCKPKRCHGDVIVELIEETKRKARKLCLPAPERHHHDPDLADLYAWKGKSHLATPLNCPHDGTVSWVVSCKRPIFWQMLIYMVCPKCNFPWRIYYEHCEPVSITPYCTSEDKDSRLCYEQGCEFLKKPGMNVCRDHAENWHH